VRVAAARWHGVSLEPDCLSRQACSTSVTELTSARMPCPWYRGVGCEVETKVDEGCCLAVGSSALEVARSAPRSSLRPLAPVDDLLESSSSPLPPLSAGRRVALDPA
jgi:hypothetical protein